MNALRDVRRVRTACEMELWLLEDGVTNSDHESPAAVVPGVFLAGCDPPYGPAHLP